MFVGCQLVNRYFVVVKLFTTSQRYLVCKLNCFNTLFVLKVLWLVAKQLISFLFLLSICGGLYAHASK